MTKQLQLTPAQMVSHVEGLCAAHKLVLEQNPALRYEDGVSLHGLDKHQRPKIQIVVIRPVTDYASYAVALHEIGHCVDPLGYQLSLSTLTKEHAAWDWAKASALCWNNEMESVYLLCIAGYEKGAAEEARQKVQQQADAARQSEARKKFIRGLKL